MNAQPDFQKMYLHLFRAVTQALDLLEQGEITRASLLLARAQCETEEIYIEEGSTEEGEDGENRPWRFP